MESKIIKSVINPTNLSCKEEQGTTWIADLEDGLQVWRQIGLDKEVPEWVRLGTLYEARYLAEINYKKDELDNEQNR